MGSLSRVVQSGQVDLTEEMLYNSCGTSSSDFLGPSAPFKSHAFHYSILENTANGLQPL